MAKIPLISVCICTHNQPRILPLLLDSLSHLSTYNKFEFEVVLAVNGKMSIARKVVAPFKKNLKLKIASAGVEPNIARTRNTCLSKAKGEYIAFIDDDEYVSSDWLYHHYMTLQKSDVSNGPTKYFFATKKPRFLLSPSIYESINPSNTNTEGYSKSTQNVCFRRIILSKLEYYFNESYGISGGEDSEFFKRIVAQGYKFSWSPGALSFEMIPDARSSFVYLFKRYFRHGVTNARFNTEVFGEKIRKPQKLKMIVFVLGQSFRSLKKRDISAFIKLIFNATFHFGVICGSIFDIKYKKYL